MAETHDSASRGEGGPPGPGSDRFELYVLGAPDLRGPDGGRASSVLTQPKRLALLTYLVLAPSPPSRASIVAVFWPDRDEERARNALNQAIHYLRRSLGAATVRSIEGDRVEVPREHVWCDARELLGDAASPEVVAAGAEDLLAGWNAEDSQPLQEWLDGARRRLRERADALVTSPTESKVPEPHRPIVASPRPSRRWLVGATMAGAAALVIALLRVSLASSTPAYLDVLLPQVVRVGDGATPSPRSIQAEVLARLPEIEGVRTRPLADSLQSLQRDLRAVGASSADVAQGARGPDYVVGMYVTVTSREARLVAILHATPALEVRADTAFNLAFENVDELFGTVPAAIAEGVAAMIQRADVSGPEPP